MLSPYRIPSSSSNTYTRKQKTPNPTERDLKKTSNCLKLTSNDLKLTSNDSVKNMKDKLKGGIPHDNRIQGCFLIEQTFSST